MTDERRSIPLARGSSPSVLSLFALAKLASPEERRCLAVARVAAIAGSVDDRSAGDTSASARPVPTRGGEGSGATLLLLPVELAFSGVALGVPPER